MAAGFLATAFLAAGFLATAFLATGFLATAFLAAGFLATAFLAAGFFALAGEDFFSNAMRASFFAGAAFAALTAATFGLPITFLLTPADLAADEGFFD